MGKAELVITIILFNLFFLIFLAATLIYIKRYRFKRKEYINEIKERNQEHQRELLATQLEIQKLTMQEIGRELHDNIGQNLTLASLYTQKILYDAAAPQVNHEIEQVVGILNNTLEELRNLSHSLTNDKIVNNEIQTLIREEADKANALQQITVRLVAYKDHIELNLMQKNVLLRITQEFIQNSIKHAACDHINIYLDFINDEELVLNIQDDGKGFEVSNSHMDGIGLRNMKKRIEIIGGTFSISSRINEGTQLTIKLNVKK